MTKLNYYYTTPKFANQRRFSQNEVSELVTYLIDNSKTVPELFFNMKILCNKLLTCVLHFKGYREWWHDSVDYKPHMTDLKVFNEYIISDIKQKFSQLIGISFINVNVVFDKTDRDEFQYNVDFYPRGNMRLDSVLVEDTIPLLSKQSSSISFSLK